MFYNKQEIYESKPDLRGIFINSKINLNFFGKLIILNNGSVYANVNEGTIGKIGQDFLIEIIREEIVNGRSWKKLRTDTAPCSQCVLQKLCPPLSNYEYILKQNNLCYL